MRAAFLLTTTLATAGLVACEPAQVKDDPIRTEVVDACEGRIEYQAMETKRRTTYCMCVYDKTMRGLTDEEKQVARFYLLAQVGVDVQSRKLIDKPNMQAMLKASKAIGDAVKQCG